MTQVGATVLFRINDNSMSREGQEGEVTAVTGSPPNVVLTILHNGQTYERPESACIGRG